MSKGCFFKTLSPSHNSGEQLRHHILWLIMIRVILFTLLIAITFVLQSKGKNVILPPPSILMAFLSVVFIYSIGSAGLLQNRVIHLPRFGLFQLLSDTLFAALLVFGTGCSQSIFAPVFIFPVIAGGLNLNRIGGLISASAATILYGIVLASEYFGYIPPFYAQTNYVPMVNYLKMTNVFAVYGITFFTIALLSSMLAARLRSTEEALTVTSLQFDRLNQLYKQIFDDISTGIITVDDRNTVTSCNIASENITGFSADELVGRAFDIFFAGIILTETDQSKQVADLIRKDKVVIRIRYTIATLNMPPDPVANKPGCTNCKVITMQDISELEMMEQHVRDSEKMAAIGELSAAIAHDFRNPLTAISGSAQILAMSNQSSEDDTLKSLTDIITRESNRMEKTITEFLQFARPTQLNLEWINLDRTIRESVDQINDRRSHYQECTIVLDIPDHLDCWADERQLQTILVHLLENSCVASQKTLQPVVIKVRKETGSHHNQINIQVIDQGTGISREIRDKIFIPFFSTRENSTGLGMGIVKQLVEQHHGTLNIPQLGGAGCVVEICLPLPSLPGD
jgi:two-component system sensor histidine kinase PilS (NtrC family)